ncbi:hypothetical protein [Streptomyces sp. NPDC020965]|uniref:hypothetical protein n=1 Tax=Streptomyces sp. NPDC020965 TaxID=3365105 RepID=UPI0037938A0B
MAITDDLRKTFTDPTPFYFAAGTADIAVQQARKVPALLEQLAADAPGRIEAVRNTDPKAVQEKVTSQAREAQATVQAKVTDIIGGFGGLDADLKRIGETAQDLALRGVGVAAEYAVRARETYEKVAEHGEQTVRTWRGEAAEEITEIAVAVEPEPVKPQPVKTQPVKPQSVKPQSTKASPAKTQPEPVRSASVKSESAAAEPAASAKVTARKTTPRKPAARKTTPPAK